MELTLQRQGNTLQFICQILNRGLVEQVYHTKIGLLSKKIKDGNYFVPQQWQFLTLIV